MRHNHSGKPKLACMFSRASCLLVAFTAAAQAQTNLSPPDADSGVWYAIPASFLLGVLAALLVYGRVHRRRRPAQTTRASAPAEAPNLNVYLVQQGNQSVRHEIRHTPCRIGRSSDRNDITLKHPSISRLHAQITVRKDGVYEITDMESLNGIFVNDRKVKSAPVVEGDVIDIGDLTFRFTSALE